MTELEVIQALLDRVTAQQALLVCFRIGKSPSEKLFKELDRTGQLEAEIRMQLGDLIR